MDRQLSSLTRAVLARESNDYVSRDTDELSVINGLMEKYGLERVYRFDIGKSTDGPSPLILEVLRTAELADMVGGSLTEYPDNHYQLLRRQLARMHEAPGQWFVFGAGLENVIDQIARAVLDPGDRVLMTIPNFDVFESVSLRMGAEMVHVPLCSPDFCLDEATIDLLVQQMRQQSVKLLWISNPVNPTGQHIPLDWISALVVAARQTDTLVVVDEAYGEYADRSDALMSASRFCPDNPHLMVLRTFSKIYCLPSARVGYMICSSPGLCRAVNAYRPMFPFSWFSLYMAQLAVIDTEHLDMIRRRLEERKRAFFRTVEKEKNCGLNAYEFIGSDTNTIMFRHSRLPAEDLHARLAARGFLTANLNRLDGIQDQQFLRLTLHPSQVNDLFLEACAGLG